MSSAASAGAQPTKASAKAIERFMTFSLNPLGTWIVLQQALGDEMGQQPQLQPQPRRRLGLGRLHLFLFAFDAQPLEPASISREAHAVSALQPVGGDHPALLRWRPW